MLNLILGEEAQIKFTVSIAGTSVQPAEVRGLLGNQLRLCVTASLVGEKEYLFTLPVLRDFFSVGPTQFVIEVHLNGKVFTPVKRDVMISDDEEFVEGAIEQIEEPKYQVPATENKLPEAIIPKTVPEVVINKTVPEVVINKIVPEAVITPKAEIVYTPIQQPAILDMALPVIKEKVVMPVFTPVQHEKINTKQFIGSIFKTDIDIASADKNPIVEDITVSEISVIKTKIPFRLTKQKVIFK